MTIPYNRPPPPPYQSPFGQVDNDPMEQIERSGRGNRMKNKRSRRVSVPSDTLLACPFCGSQAEHESTVTQETVRCTLCPATLSHDGSGAAINAMWNSRANIQANGRETAKERAQETYSVEDIIGWMLTDEHYRAKWSADHPTFGIAAWKSKQLDAGGKQA